MLAVFTAADLNPDVKEQWHTAVGPESPETPRPPLAWEEVRFVGDPVALVVASTRYLAEDAGDLVEVEYDPLAPVVAYTDAESTPDLVHPAHGSNLIGESSKDRTDELEQHLRSAPFLVSEVVSQQAYVPSPLEGRGIVVDSRPTTGELTIYSATQAPHEVRMFCARLLGIPEHRVRVIMRDTGGGFGQKVYVQRGQEMCIMLAAPKIGHPLKWVEDRHESFLAGGQARHEQARITMGFNAGGEIEAVDIDYLADCGAYPTPWPIGTGWLVGSLFPGPYRVPVAGIPYQSRVHQHGGARSLSGAVAVRDPGPRGSARPGGPENGHGSGRVDQEPARPRGPALHQPERHDVRDRVPARDLRAGHRPTRL